MYLLKPTGKKLLETINLNREATETDEVSDLSKKNHSCATVLDFHQIPSFQSP